MENSENPLVSIIILNFNGGKFLENCIKSLYKTEYNNFEIIVVDNKSSDNSHIVCKKIFQDIILIENSKNVGFCEGNNIGIRKASGEFLVILNPDTEVSGKWLLELYNAFKENGEGLYQPKILSLNNKKEIQSTGNMIQLFGFGFTRDRGELDKKQYGKIEQIGYASGACFFTSVKVFKKIGLFDPFLFLYHDDLELGWRSLQRGIKSFFVPKSTIYHAESPNLKWSNKKFYWLERNRKYCIRTHYSKKTYNKMRFSFFLIELMVSLFYLSKGMIITKLKADLDIWKNRKIIEEKNKELEENRIIPDTQIIKIFSDKIHTPDKVTSEKSNKLLNFVLEHLSKRIRDNI